MLSRQLDDMDFPIRSVPWLVSMLNEPHYFPIAEECDCVCPTGSVGGPCGCQWLEPPCGIHDTNLISSDVTMDDIDGVDDILAVSHVSEKPSLATAKVKGKPPLVRAKTLPAIIIPGLYGTAAVTAAGSQRDVQSRSPTKSGNVGDISPDPSSKTSPNRVTFTEAPGSPWKGEDRLEPVEVNSTKASPTHSSSSQFNGGSADKSRAHDAWGRLARLLNQRDKSTTPPDKSSGGQYRRRTFSLESNEDTPLRKASSIDCLVDPPSPDLTGLTESKSIQLGPGGSARLDVPRTDIPLSPSVPSKLGKNRSGWRRNSMELLTVDSLAMTKAERKKLEKLNKINIHLHALFVAVEHQQLEKVRTILENTDVDVNGLNSDGFNALDIAVMTNNIPLVRNLQSYGARENNNFPSKEIQMSHLTSLANEAEKRVEHLTGYVLSVASNTNISATQFKETEKQLSLWERRHRLLKRMKLGFDQSKPPEPPHSINLSVISNTSLYISFEEPQNQNVGIMTKFRVQWSQYEDFSPLEGEEEVLDLRKFDYTISGLEQGVRYFVRIAAGNIKGYSPYQCSTPPSAIPSIWRDVDRRSPRSAGRLSTLDDVFNQIRNSRPEYASEIKGITDQLDTPAQQRRNQMRKSIKSLFTPAPKFHKNLKRGVFLACLLFNEDRILVTTEENLPVVEVDETYPNAFHIDFHWMMKVACTWDDVKSLRQDMEKSLSSSTVYFRSKLLQAAAQMQSALGIQDLGQFFYRPLKDSSGTIVISTINQIRDPKLVNAISMKWVPFTRIQRRMLFTTENLNAGEMLLHSISEQISYHQVSRTPLPRGLYLGYLKLKSSMDLIRVLVPERTPNVLPHCLIRDNPHVSCEEWEWLKSLAKNQLKSTPSAHQHLFGQQLLKASRWLFKNLGVHQEDAINHRLYDVEVIELSSDVSFILILPAIENVCSVPGQSDELTSRLDFVTLPVQIFEMVHMTTYQRDFISRYSRLSSILEMDTIMAQHAHREAFSSSEVTTAKQRLQQLQEFQSQVDHTWKGMRWIMDVLTWARDKQASGGVLMSVLYEWLFSDLPIVDITQSDINIDSKTVQDNCDPVTNSRSRTQGLDLVNTKYCIPRVSSANTSPLMEHRSSSMTLTVNTSSQSLPKSFSDTFTECGILPMERNPPPSNEDSESSLGDAVSLSTSQKSLSSCEMPTEDAVEITDSVLTNSKSEVTEEPRTNENSEEATSNVQVNENSSEMKSQNKKSSEGAGIIRVYAAYDTGLASGTSVKLHVTPKTTAREVIDLVVKQLNMAVVLKGKNGPIYSIDQLHNFCLVAVLGARERCLRDDFRPLHLQNPWTKGRLYIRMKNDVLAALQQSNAHTSAYL